LNCVESKAFFDDFGLVAMCAALVRRANPEKETQVRIYGAKDKNSIQNILSKVLEQTSTQ
jgi:hypothetical protein